MSLAFRGNEHFQNVMWQTWRGGGGEWLGKIIPYCSSNRLSEIITKTLEEAAEIRTGKHQWLHIPNNLHCLWCYLYISWYHRVYPQSNLGFCPWPKKDSSCGQIAQHIRTSIQDSVPHPHDQTKQYGYQWDLCTIYKCFGQNGYFFHFLSHVSLVGQSWTLFKAILRGEHSKMTCIPL